MRSTLGQWVWRSACAVSQRRSFLFWAEPCLERFLSCLEVNVAKLEPLRVTFESRKRHSSGNDVITIRQKNLLEYNLQRNNPSNMASVRDSEGYDVADVMSSASWGIRSAGCFSDIVQVKTKTCFSARFTTLSTLIWRATFPKRACICMRFLRGKQ